MAGLGIEPRNNKRGEVKHFPRQVTTNKHRAIVGGWIQYATIDVHAQRKNG